MDWTNKEDVKLYRKEQYQKNKKRILHRARDTKNANLFSVVREFVVVKHTKPVGNGCYVTLPKRFAGRLVVVLDAEFLTGGKKGKLVSRS